jgi:hypothetical protein
MMEIHLIILQKDMTTSTNPLECPTTTNTNITKNIHPLANMINTIKNLVISANQHHKTGKNTIVKDMTDEEIK